MACSRSTNRVGPFRGSSLIYRSYGVEPRFHGFQIHASGHKRIQELRMLACAYRVQLSANLMRHISQHRDLIGRVAFTVCAPAADKGAKELPAHCKRKGKAVGTKRTLRVSEVDLRQILAYA